MQRPSAAAVGVLVAALRWPPPPNTCRAPPRAPACAGARAARTAAALADDDADAEDDGGGGGGGDDALHAATRLLARAPRPRAARQMPLHAPESRRAIAEARCVSRLTCASARRCQLLTLT